MKKHPLYLGRKITTAGTELAEYCWRGYYSIDGRDKVAVSGRPDLTEEQAHSAALVMAKKLVDQAEANRRRGAGS